MAHFEIGSIAMYSCSGKYNFFLSTLLHTYQNLITLVTLGMRPPFSRLPGSAWMWYCREWPIEKQCNVEHRPNSISATDHGVPFRAQQPNASEPLYQSILRVLLQGGLEGNW